MRSGCLNLVFMLVAASVATALTAAGVVLFFSFAALTFESSSTGIETILKTVVALIAAYFFVRVGMSIWRDLRGHRPAEGSGEGKEKRGPAGNGGR
jgi:hypothetical protein